MASLAPLEHSPAPSTGHVPGVWNWYRAYCAAMAVLYFAWFAGGLLALGHPDAIDHAGPVELVILGLTFTVFGLLGAYAAAPFLRRTPRTWVFHLVLICIGMTSACCLPVCIPLLVFWIKPETKEFFGRGPA